MSHHDACSPFFAAGTTEGQSLMRLSPPLIAQVRTSFPTVASMPLLEMRPYHDRPSVAQSLKSEKALQPQSSAAALPDSDDELSSIDDDSTTDSLFDPGSDQHTDVPLQELREPRQKLFRDKCFGCWEVKQDCVRRQGPRCVRCLLFNSRCNANQRAPHYHEPAIVELYEEMQAAAILRAGGKWQPIPTEPGSWIDGVKTNVAIERLFRRYNVVKPSYVRYENSRLLMSPRTAELREKRKQRRRLKRQRCATPEPRSKKSATSRAQVLSSPVRSTTPQPRTEVQVVPAARFMMLSQADVDALISPNQTISLAVEDIEEEERRIEHLHNMIVPALRKKYAILQALKSLKQGASAMERRLTLLDYQAIDQFERGGSAAYGGSRNGPMHHRMVDRLSEQESVRQRRDSADSSSVTAFEAEAPWRRFRS